MHASLSKRIKDYLKLPAVQAAIDLTGTISVRFLAQGEYNKNYVIVVDGIKKYVFRINYGSQLNLDKQISYEYQALKKLQVSGVTPPVYYCDDSRNYFEQGVLIMAYLEGRPLQYRRDLAKAAALFGKVHQLPIDDFTGHLIKEEHIFTARIAEAADWFSHYQACAQAPLAVKRALAQLWQYCLDNRAREQYFIQNPWRVVNNTEVNSHNFIIGNRRHYIIDWEKPVISDPVQDITQFLAPTTTLWRTTVELSAAEIANFYKVYCAQYHKIPYAIDERVAMYQPYLYLRALGWCAQAWVDYNAATKSLMNARTLKKINQYLEITFLSHIFAQVNIQLKKT